MRKIPQGFIEVMEGDEGACLINIAAIRTVSCTPNPYIEFIGAKPGIEVANLTYDEVLDAIIAAQT